VIEADKTNKQPAEVEEVIETDKTNKQSTEVEEVIKTLKKDKRNCRLTAVEEKNEQGSNLFNILTFLRGT
jgi:uncharacterized membrane protein YgaE (UPF0421/DUF939 family)